MVFLTAIISQMLYVYQGYKDLTLFFKMKKIKQTFQFLNVQRNIFSIFLLCQSYNDSKYLGNFHANKNKKYCCQATNKRRALFLCFLGGVPTHCSFHGESQLSGLIRHSDIDILCKETCFSKQLQTPGDKEGEFQMKPPQWAEQKSKCSEAGNRVLESVWKKKGLISLC